MNKSEQINELLTALAKANLGIINPKKTSVNPFFNSKYADLSEVINVSKQILAENGLSVIQLASTNEAGVSIETILGHSSGQWIGGTLLFRFPMKVDAQIIGSLITYARRYSWAAIVGIAQEDDDGNFAIGQPEEKQKLVSKPEQKKKEIPELNVDQLKLYQYIVKAFDANTPASRTSAAKVWLRKETGYHDDELIKMFIDEVNKHFTTKQKQWLQSAVFEYNKPENNNE